MSGKVPSTARRCFKFPHYDMGTWYPGHMFKGVQQMQKRIGDMDCVLEVHDARIPFSGRNPIFLRHAQMRPHILILSKVDLVDERSLKWMKANPDKLGANKVIFADMKNRTSSAATMIIDTMLEVIDQNDRFHRVKDERYNLLVVGIPNVGKSSLINFLRHNALRKKGRSTAVGANPGITKSLLEKIRICNDPTMFLFDTPGILAPKVESAEVALKLAVCNTVRARILGEELICDYLLYYLNRENLTRYVSAYGLDGPNDNIHEVLTAVAEKENKFLKHRIDGQYTVKPDYIFAATKMIKDFNNGLLGAVNFDAERLFLPQSTPRSTCNSND